MSCLTLEATDTKFVAHEPMMMADPEPERERCDTLEAKPTLIIGDSHGHFDRLEALLIQERILGDCPDCDGRGDTPSQDFCNTCDGDGQIRVNHDVEVVHVGDLGHFGQGGSPTGDMMSYKYAPDWFDVVLWGNHDRAVIDPHHTFGGYLTPGPEIKHLMYGLYARDKLKLAHCAHGYLITHAGLHAAWKQQPGISFDRNDPQAIAEWINDKDWWPSGEPKRVPSGYPPIPSQLPDEERSAVAVRDAISFNRGGNAPAGGILWRDEEEKLHPIPQVYGHSAQRDGKFAVHKYSPRERQKVASGIWTADAFNIDIGGKTEARLGALWLPEKRLVRVDL